MAETAKIRRFSQLFTYEGCEWVCIGGKDVGRIAVVGRDMGVISLIWKDTNESLDYESTKYLPFVAKI